MYVMNRQTLWEYYLYLVEFSYNNEYHSSIGMALYQAFYGHPFRSHLSWDSLEDYILLGLHIL